MAAPTGNGKQLAERLTTFEDKVEIYFYPDDEYPFWVFVNELSQYPFASWDEAEELYDHLYGLQPSLTIVERVEQYAA